MADKYRIETEDGSVYEIETEDAATAPAQTQQQYVDPRARLGEAATVGVKDLLAGIGAGVFQSLSGGTKLAQAAGAPWTMFGDNKPNPVQSYLEGLAQGPQSVMGQIGKFAEQGAEYLIPSGLAARGAAALTNAPRAVQILGRAGMEAAGAGGVAALQSGGDPEAMRNAALLGGVVGGATAALPMVAPRLAEAAVTQYNRVLNPTKEKTKAIAQQIVPELIQRREWAASLPRMLDRAQDRMRFFGQQIDDAWDAMAQQGTTAQIDPILRRLEDVAREHFFTQNTAGQLVQLRGPAEAGFRELQGMAQTMADAATVNPATGAREIPVTTLRQLRQYWDEVADKAGAFTKNPRDLADWARGRAARYGGDAVRAELAQARPDLAALNQEFSFWNRVADVVEQTVGRRTGQQKPLTRRIAQLAGAQAGGGGLTSLLGAYAMDQFQGLVSSPAWGTISAVTKDRLANAITQGNQGAAQFYLNQALRAAGMKAVTGRSESGAKALVPSEAQ